MSIEVSALLFEGVKKIVFTAISKRVVLAGENFLTKRRIESRINDSIAQVVEQLVPFFENEHLSDQKRQVLISNCTHELSEILDDPKEIFAASLDGQKVFDRRYEKGRLPQGVRDEGLEDLYALVFPQIANLICAFPPAIEQWKIEGYREGFRRLDDIAATLGGVASKLDQLALKDSQGSDVLLNRVRQSLAQRVEFQLDLTGLRGDRPDAVPLEKCFVVPELLRTIVDSKTNERREIRIGDKTNILTAFSGPQRRAIVTGAPGAGKSTWSRWLQRQQLTSDVDRLAVLIRLRDLIKTPTLPSQQHLIREAAGTHLREEVDANIARRWCNSGAITFILDGFDEVPPNRRDLVLAWIEELDNTAGDVGLIVTSRPLTTDHLQRLPSKWFQWQLLPFDESRITDYVLKWYANAPLLADKRRDVNAEELSSKWVNDFALQPLVGTPLMLATIVMVHHMDGELPRGRAKLYERYIDGMLGLWDSRWGVPSAIELSLDLKHRILTKLAVHLHIAGLEQLGDKELQLLMQTILPSLGCLQSAVEVLDHLRERTGLLIGPGTWSFVHKNVGEFVVAAAIRDGDCIGNDGQKLDRLRLFAERYNDRWNNVLFFWAGLTAPGDLQSFIEQVSNESSANDFILALSLFYDQLQPHRLTEPWRTEQLLRLLRKGLQTTGFEMVNCICGPVPQELKISVRAIFPRLRLPEVMPFQEVLWDCLKFSNVSWTQASNSHQSLRFITWIFFTTRPRNANDLRSALDKRNWVGNIPSEWLMFPPSWGINTALTGRSGISIVDFIEVLGQSCPELKPKFPFFLLGALVTYLAEEYRRGPKIKCDNLFLVLASIRDQDLDKEWLQLSSEFVMESWGGRPFDLLTRALEILEEPELVDEVNPEVITEIRDYVRFLIDARNSASENF